MVDMGNQRLARLLAENPNLPVKFRINGPREMIESEDDVFVWYTGSLCGFCVTEYVESYELDGTYFGRDDEDLYRRISNAIWIQRSHTIEKTLPETYPNYNALSRWQQLAVIEDLTNKALPDDQLDRLAQERIEALDWTLCILLEIEL